jgi:predicted extracellular nuclease
MNVTTLTVATSNVMNLAAPNRVFYPNQDPYSAAQYQRKVEWLGQRLAAVNADVVAVQEVWDESALKAAVHASAMRYSTVIAPGAEQDGQLQGSPAVGLVTRLEVLATHSLRDLPVHAQVDIPDMGLVTQFARPPLVAKLRMKHGLEFTVVTAHLKSKRPKYLIDDQGNHLEDRDDPAVTARATLRSLLLRASEATGLRSTIAQLLANTHEPLVLMGDFNDSPHSVTTQLMAATSEAAYNRRARDTALYNVWEVQSESALKRDVGYSHVYQGWPELLDHILVSEEFVPTSRFSVGDVRRVDAFNDHLHEGRHRHTSDHGIVRALFRVQLPE